MTINMRLVPLTQSVEVLFSMNKTILPATILETDIDSYEFCSQFIKIDGYPKPQIKMHSFPKGTKYLEASDEGLVDVYKDDRTGGPLYFVYAHQLLAVAVITNAEYSKNIRAALAYIRELPSDTKIFLFFY